MHAPEQVERRLAAILAADVAGYSRHVALDDRRALTQLTEIRHIAAEVIESHRGVVVDTAGDSCLAHFASVTDAVVGAVALQKRLAELNKEGPAERAMEMRIGIHLGDLLMRGREVFGDGVNVAARLQAEAEPGGICLSAASREQLPHTLDLRFEEIGELSLKNIERPVRAYRVISEAVRRVEEAPALPVPDKPSIAVLPFTNMSGDPEQEYFADGITEDIITALSRVGWLFVIARNSSFTYKGRTMDVRQVSRELGVRYVLEGSVRRSGPRLRISGQLIDARSGHHLWAGKSDGSCEDIFDLQDQVTEAVAAAVVPSLRKVEIERARHKPTDKLDAYDLYLRALSLIRNYNREDNERAIALLGDALERAPEFARAAALASNAYCLRVVQGWQVDASAAERERALELAERALRFGHDDSDALANAAWSYTWLSHRPDVGLDAIRRAFALNPSSTMTCKFAGWIHCWTGDTARAIEFFEKASRLDPLDPHRHTDQCGIAWSHLLDRRFPEAVEWSYRAFSGHSGYLPTLRVLAAALAHANRTEEAHHVAGRLLELSPRETVSWFAGWTPVRHAGPEKLSIVLEGLRAAGIPE